MVKLSSTKRVISQFQGKPLSEVKYISSLGKGDEPQIRQALGKPHLKDSSARAQARLARQYVNLLSNPSADQRRHVKQITGKTLKPKPAPNRPNPNAQTMGNVQRTPQQQQQQQRQPIQRTTKPSLKWTRKVTGKPSSQHLPQQIQEMEAWCYRQLNSAGEREYQVIIFLQMDTGQTRAVSCAVHPTTDASGVSKAFAWIIFTPGGPAVYKGKKPSGVMSIRKVVMRFR
jgi:hypothetical protein